VQKYGTIYAGDARLKTIARNKAEEAAIAEIARKKEEAYTKKMLARTGIVYRQAARWGFEWAADIRKRRGKFIGMLEREFMPALERRNARRALKIKERRNLHLNGYIEEEPIVL
jgi:hypothetical protein